MLLCVCTGNAHLFIVSLSTIVNLWNKEKEITGDDNMKGIVQLLTTDLKCKKEFVKVSFPLLVHVRETCMILPK